MLKLDQVKQILPDESQLKGKKEKKEFLSSILQCVQYHLFFDVIFHVFSKYL